MAHEQRRSQDVIERANIVIDWIGPTLAAGRSDPHMQSASPRRPPKE